MVLERVFATSFVQIGPPPSAAGIVILLLGK